MPRPIDGLAAIFYTGVLIVYGYMAFSGFYEEVNPWLGGAVMTAAIVVLIVIDRLEYHYLGEQSPWPTTLALLVVRMVIIAAASLSDGLGFAYPSIFLLVVPFSFFLLAGSSYGFSGMIWTMYLMGRWRDVVEVAERAARTAPPPPHGPRIFDLTFFLTLAFIASIAYLIRQERTSRLRAESLLHELEASHRQLQNYAEQVAELATTEERNRLAREIHDSLGHYMTVINVQLEKAIAFKARDAEAADQALKDAKHLASEALKDIRRSVGTLRSTPEKFSLAQALAGLVAHLESSQMTIDLQIEGDETGFSKQSLQTLYRAAQEGLTNIQKHAQASRVTVHIKLEDQQASLMITDDGQGFDPALLAESKQESHYGLQGIRERLELVRGSFKVESAPNHGTSLLVTVPKNPLALLGG
ncbi:MAG: two-component sensor histidine kinase [Chloroflexota bacterium]|nr:MAG: two-component sensor histidine kinase [Chloroflexota bacterium]